MELYRRLGELEVLAELDESGSYETDVSYICRDRDTGKFYLITASGCSCWDGEYYEEEYDTFHDLQMFLLKGSRDYNPSLTGARTLIRDACKSLGVPENKQEALKQLMDLLD